MPPSVLRRIAGPIAAALVVLGLTGCGGAPGTIGPTGVDQLTIPTPSPDPSDFVAGVDNRWLPLPPTGRWTYRVDGTGGADTVRLEVTARPSTVAGVATTQMHLTELTARGGVLREVDSWYAQDVSGNVWLLGEDDGRTGGSWRAASAGAEAGVAMLAEPRLGDGYWRVRAPGVAEQRVRVRSVSDTLSTPLGELTEVVVLEITEGSATSTRWYAPGLGLVAAESGGSRLTLVSTSLDRAR